MTTSLSVWLGITGFKNTSQKEYHKYQSNMANCMPAASISPFAYLPTLLLLLGSVI